ncbi:hypothetical protein [Streptomyces niveus]|uniref:hypothetical protein n=1 Tax=Streptomyces niveus TaxID=193462 RepID=UPI00386CBAAC
MTFRVVAAAAAGTSSEPARVSAPAANKAAAAVTAVSAAANFRLRLKNPPFHVRINVLAELAR